MILLGAVRWLLILGVASYGAGFAAGVGSSFLTRPCAETTEPRYDMIVVLGAGVNDDGTPGTYSARRMASAVALFEAGVAPRIHATGDGHPDPDLSAAAAMAAMAPARALPPDAVTVETASESTLENALFSRPWTGEAGDILLISTGFHLWRGAASMAWAGTPVAGLCHSTRFGETGDATLSRALRWGHYEGIRWPVNVARAAGWSLAGGLGLQDQLPDWWLH